MRDALSGHGLKSIEGMLAFFGNILYMEVIALVDAHAHAFV